MRWRNTTLTQGRDWERFAMVKARAGKPETREDIQQLQQILQPFTYRKYLDFGAIDLCARPSAASIAS